MEPEETVVARQQLDKRVSAATDSHATTENPLKTVFLYAGYIMRASRGNPASRRKRRKGAQYLGV